METHVKAVGWLHIIYGAFGIVIGFFIFFVLGSFSAIFGMQAPDPQAAMIVPSVIMFVAMIISGFLLICSIPGIIAGWGLLNGANWARILAIILSVLYIPFQIPIGSILGIYSLVVLLTPEATRYFEQPSAPPPPPPQT